MSEPTTIAAARPFRVSVFYTTPRGAHTMQRMLLSDVPAFLARQRRTVTVRNDGAQLNAGPIIGGVERCECAHADRGPMSRPHWHWWLEGNGA